MKLTSLFQLVDKLKKKAGKIDSLQQALPFLAVYRIHDLRLYFRSFFVAVKNVERVIKRQ